MSDWYLQVHVYDRDVEYEILMQQASDTPWEKGGDGTRKQYEVYWKNRYNKKYMERHCEDYEPSKSVTLPAPMEFQPQWDIINVEEFIEDRMSALEKIGMMEHPVMHKWHTWCVIGDDSPSGEPTANNPLDEFLGYKLYQPKINSWGRVWPSDKNLYNYVLLREKLKGLDCVTNPLVKGFEPEGWHDEYLEDDEPWYSDLPGYGTSQGVYLNDGVYGHGGPQLVWKSLTDEEMYEPDEYYPGMHIGGSELAGKIHNAN
jgi:hypothetical protein